MLGATLSIHHWRSDDVGWGPLDPDAAVRSQPGFKELCGEDGLTESELSHSGERGWGLVTSRGGNRSTEARRLAIL